MQGLFMKRFARFGIISVAGILAALAGMTTGLTDGGSAQGDLGDSYGKRVQPLLKKYCLECHSTKAHKGDLDLERFTSLAAIRKDLKPWQHLIEQVEVGEMPPKN